ncbi:hypothetical protein CDAR_517191 [Caerostris darwini]|uniref:Uncharacterized protein n=1 Tax=Caerostris darwini TaxID=1538125 RepID=A0AAV4S6L4_9ARAC|nr:hypothetical protein CDAR_517191 [Caerostris darwini]
MKAYCSINAAVPTIGGFQRTPFHQERSGDELLNKDTLSSHSSGIRSICMPGSESEPVQLLPLLLDLSLASLLKSTPSPLISNCESWKIFVCVFTDLVIVLLLTDAHSEGIVESGGADGDKCATDGGGWSS